MFYLMMFCRLSSSLMSMVRFALLAGGLVSHQLILYSNNDHLPFCCFFYGETCLWGILKIIVFSYKKGASRIILVFQARRLWRQILRAARTTSSLPTKVTHLELLTNCWINFLIDNHVFHIAGSTMWFQETSSINQQTFPLVLTLATKIVFSPVRKYIVPVDQISQKEPPIYH